MTGHGLIPQAVAPHATRGRQHDEPSSAESPFELDRRRILNCMAFRRLMHKTQVFVSDGGDHFRTRLTHTLEVASQAERLARLLSINDRLAGAIALAHDLGHPPFGHAGEVELAALMSDHGGFEHNMQSLRVVDYLEHPYPDFRGLNLTFELCESLVKHQTRYDRPERSGPADARLQSLRQGGPSPPLEGQVANLADAIAYTLHDIEDGIGEGALDETILRGSRLWCAAWQQVCEGSSSRPLLAVRRPVLDALAARLSEDAAEASRARIAASKATDVDSVRRHPQELIGFSDSVRADVDELQDLLLKRVYRNHRVVRMDSKARRLIREVFQAYLAEPQLLPERFFARVAEQGPHRVICDYVAGMTDRFCQREHKRLFAPFSFD